MLLNEQWDLVPNLVSHISEGEELGVGVAKRL